MNKNDRGEVSLTDEQIDRLAEHVIPELPVFLYGGDGVKNQWVLFRDASNLQTRLVQRIKMVLLKKYKTVYFSLKELPKENYDKAVFGSGGEMYSYKGGREFSIVLLYVDEHLMNLCYHDHANPANALWLTKQYRWEDGVWKFVRTISGGVS